jgi:hypothetical protein
VARLQSSGEIGAVEGLWITHFHDDQAMAVLTDGAAPTASMVESAPGLRCDLRIRLPGCSAGG